MKNFLYDEDMTTHKRISLNLWWVLLGLGVLTLLIGSFADLPIDANLYNPRSRWALFLYSYGSAPVYWCMECAGAILLFQLKAKTAWKTVLLKLFGALLILLAVIFSFQYAKNLAFASGSMTVFLSLCIFEFPSFLFYGFVYDNPRDMLVKLVILLLVVSVGSTLIVNIMKNIWLRPRYIVLLKEPGLTFQPWWLITRVNYIISKQVVTNSDFFKSFPSGHTQSAACIFCLCILPYYNRHCIQYKYWILAGCIIFTGIVAFSRLVLGYHFLSDVSMGYLITLSLYVMCYWLLFVRKKAGISTKELKKLS